ncbi:T9SS type A sorting domain-containing protein, partial [Maribacter aurantiacus]
NTQTTEYTFTPDDGECANEAKLTIEVTAKVDPTFDAVGPICEGDDLSALPTTSTNGITGTWSPALDNTQTTEYTFTPDDGECANEAKLTIEVNQLPENPEFKIENATCDTKGSARIINYMTGLEYTFLPTGPIVDGSGSVTGFLLDTAYSVTVKDIKSGCESGSTIFSIGSWQEMSCSIVQDKLTTDHLTKDGVATVTPYGGMAPFTYLWDNGETTQTATTLTYGMHSVTITDANGCSTMCQIDIAKELYCWVNLIQNVSEYGGKDGAARVSGNGGYRPFTFQWDDGTTEATNRSLTAGIHTVTITDAKGATSQCSITIMEPTGSVCDKFTSDVEQVKLTTDHLTEDGVATVTPYGGTAPYTYYWDNGETTQTATTLTYGMHSVTVTDANGCESMSYIDIAKELYCWVNLIQNVSEYGGQDGAARVSGNGGYRPFTFKWDDGSTEATNRSLTAGMHTVTITDAKGATSQCSITITQPGQEICDGVDNDGDGKVDEGFDADGDGIADCFDDCDDRLDSDQDGVPDCFDICPNGDDTKDTDGDGVPDTCDVEECDGLDNDGDGKVDEGFDADMDGIADCFDDCDDNLDSDQDGVPDCSDKCPGYDDNLDSDGDGTPDCMDDCDDTVDTDGDGIVDCDDQEMDSPCPDNVDANGVSLDTDGDGVVDCLDKCEGFDDTLDSDGDGTPDGCDVEECDGVDNDGDGDIDEDVILPTVEFVAFGEIRIDAGIQYNLSGGSPDGGTYSGPGVTDNGDGTYTFDPVAAGLGEHTLTYIYTNGNGCYNSATDVVNVLEAVPFTVLINEFQPNPSGNDPSTQMIELKGPAGQPFAGWIVILDSDSGNASGGVNDVEQISGTFDANGLLTVSIPDVENPSFTLILTDNYQDGIDDFDSDNDGQLDSDISNLGNVLDAIGVPDATGDENFLFGTQLGGDDFKFTGAEPMLVFRDSNTNAWYAINDHTDGMAYDLDSNPYTFSSFSGNLEGPTFGMVNPYMLTTARTFQMELWPNPTVEILNLEVPKASGIIRFDLYDISGKLVKSVPGNSWNLQQIDVRSLESGVYIIRANGGSSNNMIKKFIKR